MITQNIQEPVEDTGRYVADLQLLAKELPPPPDGSGYQRYLFDIARRIMAAPELEEFDTAEAWYAVQGFVQRWKDNCGSGFKAEVDAVAAYLMSAMWRVKVPYGDGPLERCMRNAIDAPPPPKLAKSKPGDKLVFVANVCRELAIHSLATGSDGTFYIGMNKLAKASKGTPVSISNREAEDYLKLLARLCIIEIVEKGESGKRGKATVYRFIDGPLVDEVWRRPSDLREAIDRGGETP